MNNTLSFFFFSFLKVLSLLYVSPLSPCFTHKCVNLAHVRCLTWFRSLLGIWLFGLYLGKVLVLTIYINCFIWTHTKYRHTAPWRITCASAFISLKERKGWSERRPLVKEISCLSIRFQSSTKRACLNCLESYPQIGPSIPKSSPTVT